MATEFLKWSDEYALGIREIDVQHKKLLDIINKIYTAFVERNEDDVLKDALKEMADYTDYHFKTEERYFKQFDYPKTDEHLAYHQTYVDKINTFQKELEKGTKITFSVMNFLRNWLLEHIQKKDREYVALFQTKGIK